MTSPSAKTIWIGLAIAAVIAIIVLLFLHNGKLDMAISKLDSARMRLDTAQVRIDNSQKTISAMQSELSQYQKTVLHLDTSVMKLDINSKKNQQQFNRKIENFSGDYAKFENNLQGHKRTYWPNVTVDTSRKQ